MPDLGFAICVEAGALERQATLLCASIRRFGGRLSDCPIYAVSPRPGQRPSPDTVRRLDELGVDYLEENLNVDYAEFPMIANKPLVAAHVEASRCHEVIVVLDTDTLILSEPTELLLEPFEDVAVRPADTVGVASRGVPEDRFDPYWRELCAAAGVAYDPIPLVRTFVDQIAVKAVHQTGCLAVRRDRSILRSWGRYLTGALQRGIGPPLDDRSRRNSVELLTGEQSRWWGTDISALTLAIWGTTRRVRMLSSAYNYPLHLHARVPAGLRPAGAADLAHVHYHWLLDPGQAEDSVLFDDKLGLPEAKRAWIRAQMAHDRR